MKKKARFLDKVQNESEKNFPLNFNIKLFHYDEKINDTYCTRGDFRKVMHAIDSLQKYGFEPKITIINIEKTDPQELLKGFEKVFNQYGIIQPEILIQTNNENNGEIIKDLSKLNFMTVSKNLNCAKSRVFSSSGVFSCPNLVGDNRGRLGTDLKTFSKTNYLETENCTNCLCREMKM